MSSQTAPTKRQTRAADRSPKLGSTGAKSRSSSQAPRSESSTVDPPAAGAGGAIRPAGWSFDLEAVGSASVRRLRGRRIGGVAPFVPPKNRLGQHALFRRWERRGFVPLSPGRPKLRHRILPRSVIGISAMLMAFGVGAAFSGAAFYAYYDKRLAENEETVARFVDGFDQQFTDATGSLDDLRVEAVTDIRAELSPLGDYVDDANGVLGLPQSAGRSVWNLQTRDEAGEPVSGAAFAVARHDDGTALITSYSLIVASVTAPNPPIELVKDNRRLTAQLWTWDEQYDVAILVVDAEIPTLPLATVNQQASAVGARTFALSGVGGQGATASPGVLLDRSQVGVQHTAPVGSLFVGGPLLTGAGNVVGFASLSYSPDGIDPGRVLWAPDVSALCASVLACAEDEIDGLEVDIAGSEPEGAPAD